MTLTISRSFDVDDTFLGQTLRKDNARKSLWTVVAIHDATPDRDTSVVVANVKGDTLVIGHDAGPDAYPPARFDVMRFERPLPPM